MESIIAYLFRFFFYVFFGLVLETIFSVVGIDKTLSYNVERRVPKKYLEGFVSLYMIPVHGILILFGFELVYTLIADWFFLFRYCFWAISFTLVEALAGWIYDKILGFYPWDYYSNSRFKIFSRGYTLWTLIPLWGIAGMVLEIYSQLMVFLSPYAVQFFVNLF